MTTQNSNTTNPNNAASGEKFGRARWVKEMGVSPFYRLEEMAADFEAELNAVYAATGVKPNRDIDDAISGLRIGLLNEMESTLDDWRAGKLTPEHQTKQQAADEGYESDDAEVEVEEVDEAVKVNPFSRIEAVVAGVEAEVKGLYESTGMRPNRYLLNDLRDVRRALNEQAESAAEIAAESTQDAESEAGEDEAEEPGEPQACVCEHLQAKPGEGASPLIELVFQLGLFIERAKLVYRACGFEESAINEMPVTGMMQNAYAEILSDSKLIEDDWRAGRLPSIDEASFGLPGDSNSPRETLASIDLASFKVKRLIEEVKGLCSPFAFASNAGNEPCGKAWMALKSARKNLRKLHESIINDVAESASVGGVVRAGA